MSVLLVLLGARQFGWKGAVGAILAGVILAGVGWASSSYLRERVTTAISDVQSHGADNAITAVGLLTYYSLIGQRKALS